MSKMAENLVHLLNKLSYQIVSQEYEDDLNPQPLKKREKSFKKCLKRVKQKGFDVLLDKSNEPPPDDPCVTDYGGNWSPVTLLTDYGRELKSQGHGKYNDILLSSINTLQVGNFAYANEMFKFLLLLKKPLLQASSNLKQKGSKTPSVLASNSMESISLLIENYPTDLTGKLSISKKALQYEESWNKLFDSKFEFLGEKSKLNLYSMEKNSLDSFFSSKTTTQSQSNSFVFTDFFCMKDNNCERNFFEITFNPSDTPLLDSFVDTPITHKLPPFAVVGKSSSRLRSISQSSAQIKRRLDYLPEEYNCRNIMEENPSVNTFKEGSGESLANNAIKLKRSSNCSHSFSILYKKSNSLRSDSDFYNDDSFFSLRQRRKDDGSGCMDEISRMRNSKGIILGIWAYDQALIKEFRPELADNFPQLIIITQSKFVEDIKYLMTGIESDTFKIDSRTGCFVPTYGTCLEDVTPESLIDYSKEFLDIGNYYLKLRSQINIIGKENFRVCRTICQAFWKSVFDFLELHYAVVVEIPSTTNLIALKALVMDLFDVMTVVANICKVTKPNETLPQGGELLTYLLQVVETLNGKSVTNIVFGILFDCCKVYLRRILQTWMFRGLLKKPNFEFFVDYRRQNVKKKNRAYYNAFYIESEKIPSFLQGYEENIFNCGKSIHFLKLFNPDDDFCQILEKADYPDMNFCFTDTQLQNLEKEFRIYGTRVKELCGNEVSVKSMREEERKKEKLYFDYVKEFKKLQENQKKEMQMKRLEFFKAQKALKTKLLIEQKNFIEKEKARRKEEEEAERVLYEEEKRKEAEKKAELQTKAEGLLKNYFGDVLKNLENQYYVASVRKEELQRVLAGGNVTVEQIKNVINSNKNTIEKKNVDAEGNIIGSLDVNSNTSLVSCENSLKESDTLTSFESAGSTPFSQECLFDENSNTSTETLYSVPNTLNSEVVSETFLQEKTKTSEFDLWKTLSYQTTSAEAARNKMKILSTEFDFGVIKAPKIVEVPSAENSFSDLQRNKKKVLEEEFEILHNSSEHNSLKAVNSEMEITNENLKVIPLISLNNKKNDDEISFDKVVLNRKAEYADFESESGLSTAPIEASNDSSCSLICDVKVTEVTSQYEQLGQTEETALQIVEEEKEEEEIKIENYESNLILVNKNYQNALIADMEVFRNKAEVPNIFSSLLEPVKEDVPAMNLMKFRRCLTKSVLIPLKVQEKLANKALLKLILKGEKFLSHLKSLKNYFFLNDGEFGRSLTYNTFRSLAKCTEPQEFFERSNLSRLVNEALSYTIHNFDPNLQNLSFQIVEMPPFLNHSSHDVLSPFELTYTVDWPLNIILTEKLLNKYKKVFKFLLKLKRINWTLHENFLLLNSQFKNRKFKGKVLVSSSHYHKIQVYRHAMTEVMLTLNDYIFTNGIECSWIYFLKDLDESENIDDLYEKHVTYIKEVLSKCFLSKDSQDLLDFIHNMIELVLKFHYTSISSLPEIVDGKYEHPKFQTLKTTFNEFSSISITFLKTLKEKITLNQVRKEHQILVEKFHLKLT